MNCLAFLEKEIHSVIIVIIECRNTKIVSTSRFYRLKQNCIDFENTLAVIIKEHCLHCGNCFSVCPHKAIIKEG